MSDFQGYSATFDHPAQVEEKYGPFYEDEEDIAAGTDYFDAVDIWMNEKEIIDNLEEYIDIDKLYELNENNVIGVFIREMRKKDLNNPVNKKAFKLGIKALMNKGE